MVIGMFIKLFRTLCKLEFSNFRIKPQSIYFHIYFICTVHQVLIEDVKKAFHLAYKLNLRGLTMKSLQNSTTKV